MSGALDALMVRVRIYERTITIAVVCGAIALRVLLVAYAPLPFGYVWDPYYAGVALLFSTGRLPLAEDCWACFHPPLYYLLGWPFYAFGHWLQPRDDSVALRMLGGLALLSAAMTVFYGARLLRLFRCRGGSYLLGLALLLSFPCLFISSYAPEADIVLTAILTAFLYYFVRYTAQPSLARPLDALRIGALAGCAAGTKYSGLLAPVTIAIVLGLQFVRAPSRRLAAYAGAMLLVAALIGGWKYVDNTLRYGNALHANGSASQGFAIADGRTPGARYEFTTLRLRGLRRLLGPRPPAGELTTFPVYLSVWTTLHALAWSDMSFFSVPSRHGDPSHPYPRRTIPVTLVMSVILLGFVPEVLAIAGLLHAVRHRTTRPLAIFVAVGAASYVWWLLPQQFWALKTKYVLFMLAPAVLFMLVGLGWLQRRLPVAFGISLIALTALIALANIYLYAFARGRL